MEERHCFEKVKLELIKAFILNPIEVGVNDLQPLVNSPLPVKEKYREINAEHLIVTNVIGEPFFCLRKISLAFNILEKYGRNLLNPLKPKYWRSVKFNNPVFKSTVDAIQGGRIVLRLYGYTEEQPDGMSFRDEVQEPDPDRVASVTLEVTLLRLELELLLENKHPHPEIFQELLQGSHFPEPSLHLQPSLPADSGMIPDLSTDTVHPKTSYPSNIEIVDNLGSCALCGEQETTVHCPTCQQALCSECDERFHKHPSRALHQRKKVATTGPLSVSPSTLLGSPPTAAPLSLKNPSVGPSVFTSPKSMCPPNGSSYFTAGVVTPDRPKAFLKNVENPAWDSSPTLAISRPPWQCMACSTMNEARSVLCVGCDRPRGCKTSPAPEPEVKTRCSWSCQACTYENESAAVLCVMCERPRLARKPSLMPPEPSNLIHIPQATVVKEVYGWDCEHCTFRNTKPGSVCEVCNRTSAHASGTPVPTLPTGLLPMEDLKLGSIVPPPRPKFQPVPHTPVNGEQEFQRQQQLRDQGTKLVNMIRVAEASGITPEEVYCAVQYSCTEVPVQWLQTELPYVLDAVVELTAQKANGAVGAVTHLEAKKAWLSCAGNIEEAALECVNIRKKKIKEIEDLGFRDSARILQSLYINAGDVGRAVTELQRQLLEPFHTRLWEEHEPELHFDSADKQSLVRRILAIFSLPSWGRAELVLNLMQEEDRRFELQDIVAAVRESHDKEFIKRMLTQECVACFDELPRNRMKSPTSCQCTICPECFKMHFTVAVKEKHIKDMVCPGCNQPEITDEGELLSYFSNLDIQLRDCLDPETLDLFHKKLTERTLMKDPKFVWCTHCSFGFIYERQQLEAQCPQCKQSFCIKCKRLWEGQHQGITCEEFLNWKRQNDPQYQAQGLAMYLQENGIDCPHCKFKYALARGGCMHFVCSQCRHQFCSGCYNTFHTKNKCTEPACPVNKTLHAHHPRDCLFYLRDWDVDRLQKLLQNNNVVFNTEPPAGTQAAPGGGCRVLEQKEGVDGLKDEPCGKETTAGHAGLCQSHYKEYLVRLINNHALDPAVLCDMIEMIAVCRRYLPPQAIQKTEAEDDATYCARILNKLTKDIPLGERIPRKM